MPARKPPLQKLLRGEKTPARARPSDSRPGAPARIPPAPRSPRRSTHKYGAVKTTVNGETYDSGAEATYSLVLATKLIKREIASFSRGKTIVLIPGKRDVKVTWTPDFDVYENDGGWYVVDVKGKKTAVWLLKMRLLRHFRPDVRVMTVERGVERWHVGGPVAVSQSRKPRATRSKTT